MQCEFCDKKINSSEVSHGIRFGTADGATELFMPERDSAWTVICASCGETIYKIVYAKFSKPINNRSLRVLLCK